MQTNAGVVNLRSMNDDDLPEILQIEQECFPDDWFEEWEFWAHMQQSNQFALLCQLDGVVAGFILYSRLWNEVYIDQIAVAKSARGHGLGEAMLRYAISQLPKLGRSQIGLHVRSDNQAQRLYSKVGFVSQEQSGRFYDDGTEAIEMNYRSTPLPRDADAAPIRLNLVGARRR